MEKRWRFFILIAFVWLLLSVSCSSTKIKTIWKDKDYNGERFNKILIIGVAKNPTIRRVFEDEFAVQLKVHGTDVLTSYRVISDEGVLDKAKVESKMKELEADAVLVTRMVDKKTERRGGDSYSKGWHNYYSKTYIEMHSVDNYYEFEVFSCETNLYETKTGKLIWSGLTDSFIDSGMSGALNTDTVEKGIKSLVKIIMKSLSQSQLI